MAGVIQSYELFDSIKYNKARLMKQMLDEEKRLDPSKISNL